MLLCRDIAKLPYYEEGWCRNDEQRIWCKKLPRPHDKRELVTCCYVAGTLLSLHNMDKIAQQMLGSYCIARLLLSFLVGQSDGVASQWLCHVCTGWTNLQTRQQLDDVLKECWWVSATWENVLGKRWTLSCIDMVETAKGLFAVPIPCKDAARFGQKKKAC